MRYLARSTLLTLALLATSCLAAPVARSILTIPLKRQIQQALSFLSFAEDDNSDAGPTYDASATNQQVQVITAVGTGNGQTFPNMLVDTGSAFLWVNAGQTKYSPGPHSQLTNDTFNVGYGGGGATGDVYVDQVTIGAATVAQQYVGAATNVTAFTELVNFDGILGLGRDIGNNGSISGLHVTPTFVDSLYDEGTIAQRVIGIYLTPYTDNGTEDEAGEITFGGMDASKFVGDIVYAPQTTDNTHWAVNIDAVTYGSLTLQNTSSEAIVDTGTLPILLPFTSFFSLVHALNGTIYDSGPLAGWLSVPPNITLETLTLQVGGVQLPIPPSAYLLPESLYAHYNVSGPTLPTWFASGGFGHGALGQKFLELYYSVYDSDNERVGFAPTIPTLASKIVCPASSDGSVLPQCNRK